MAEKSALDAAIDAEMPATAGSPQRSSTPVAAPPAAPASPLDKSIDAEYQKDLKAEKYGSLGQQAITAVEGVAEGILGPLAPALEVAGGVPLADIKGRQEENTATKTVGEIGGLIGSAYIPGTQGALLAKAGNAAAKGLGVAGKAGYIAKAADMGVRGAVESGLFQGGKEVTEMFQRAPGEAADNAIADIGLATVMGGVFGGAFGAAAQRLTASKAPGVLVSQADVAAVEAGDLAAVIQADEAIPKAKKNGLIEAFKISKQKANAKDILNAQKELGAPVTPGMLLDSPFIQMNVDALANSPYTFAGNKVRSQLDEAYDIAEQAIKGATESANKATKDELGEVLKNSLSHEIRSAYAPQKAAFEELTSMHGIVPVEREAVLGLRQALEEIKEVKLGGASNEAGLVRQILDMADNVKTAEDITTLRGMAALKDASTHGSADPLGRLKGIIRDKLEEMQDDAVAKAAKSFSRNDEAGAYMASLIEKAENAKANYKPYIEKVKRLSEGLGKGKVHGTEDALRFMNEKLSASDVAGRLFSSSKDPEFIRFFAREFPTQFEMVRDYQRMALREAAMDGEAFSIKKFFNKFEKLEPEIQQALYTREEIRKIHAANTYVRHAFPKNFNPSGTAHVLAQRLAHETPKSMLIANARDYAMEKFIHMAGGQPEIKNAHVLGTATARGFNTAKNAVKSVFDKSKEMPAKVIPIIAHREKLNRIVEDYAKQPEKIFAINENNPVPEYAEPFAATTANAVSYLNSLRPQNDPKNPLDAKAPVNQVAQAKYNRALDIANQPLSVLKHVKEGTLTSDDVTTIKTIYPNLYQQLQNKAMGQMIETISKGGTVPYQTRLGLSLLMGQPMDSTMTPQAIVDAQPLKAPQDQQQGGIKPPPASSVKPLSKMPQQYRTPGQAAEAGNQKAQ